MNWLTKLTELACYGLTHCAVAAHLSDCACQSTWFCCNSDLCNINTAANYGPPEPTHIADRSRYFGVMGWNNLIDRSRSHDVSETIACVCVAPVIAVGLCNVCLGLWRVLQTPTRGTRPIFLKWKIVVFQAERPSRQNDPHVKTTSIHRNPISETIDWLCMCETCAKNKLQERWWVMASPEVAIWLKTGRYSY